MHVEQKQKGMPLMKVLTLGMKRNQKNEEIEQVSMVMEEIEMNGGEEQERKEQQYNVVIERNVRRRGEKRWERVRDEKELLTYLGCKIEQIDPDIIMGYQIEQTLDRLVEKCKQKRVQMKMMRVRKEKQVMGRLVCDIYRLAQEHLPQQSMMSHDYSLCSLVAHLDTSRHLLLPLLTQSSISSLLKQNNYQQLIEDSLRECQYQSFVMHRLQFLQLSFKKSLLTGQLWNRSLANYKAEAIDLMLMHVFYQANYILPDSSLLLDLPDTTLEQQQQQQQHHKYKYKGGLVLTPQLGMHDKYVLLLDFTSLYPSIIQEYQLCLSERDILPQVLKGLVNRRQEVKEKIKRGEGEGEGGENSQILQIEQQTLKVLANSVYGCLGYKGSRFYCVRLAGEITRRGREVLKETMQTVEEKGGGVIYGDTDSVLVSRECLEEEVEGIGEDIVKTVNGKYRVLRLVLERVYVRLLLQAKKKYVGVVWRGGGLEVKGMDIKRRECSFWSKYQQLLLLQVIMVNRPLSDTKEIVLDLLKYVLDTASTQPFHYMILNRKINKHPSLVSNGQSIPHLQAVMRLIKEGGYNFNQIRQTYLDYLICYKTQVSNNVWSVPLRLFNPSEQKVNLHYYLHVQLLPPFLRLTHFLGEPFQHQINHIFNQYYLQHGFDQQSNNTVSIQKQVTQLQVQHNQPIQLTQNNTQQLMEVTCIHCHHKWTFNSLLLDNICTLFCSQCSKIVHINMLINKISFIIKKAITQQNDKMICQQKRCHLKRQNIKLTNTKCIDSQCYGSTDLEFQPDQVFQYISEIYNIFELNNYLDDQQLDSLFNQDVQYLCNTVQDFIKAYLPDLNIDLKQLFSFTKNI